ncbi:COX assembly mitochondrial [Trichonephila clavipes]|nr:COX assembly mitochondrial [Trichonephila clavipes]
MNGTYLLIFKQVEIEGAFHGRARNIKCVFELMLDDQIHNKIEFFGSGNGTLVQCLVQLQVGMYRVGVRLEVGDPKEDFIEDSELFVYEQVRYTSMSPKQAVLDKWGPQELIVTFTGSNVPNLPLICIISSDAEPPNTVIQSSALEQVISIHSGMDIEWLDLISSQVKASGYTLPKIYVQLFGKSGQQHWLSPDASGLGAQWPEFPMASQSS